MCVTGQDGNERTFGEDHAFEDVLAVYNCAHGDLHDGMVAQRLKAGKTDACTVSEWRAGHYESGVTAMVGEVAG